MARGTIVIIGSGETAPNMVKVHRELLSRLTGTPRAVLLDTPFGFQENVPQLTEKIVDYFSTSLQLSMAPLSFTRASEATALQRASFLEGVRASNFVFTGPGSPSYAVTQWKEVDLTGALIDVLEQDGIACFSSAAALTLGAHTAPIYEIYKAGEDIRWLDGLDLLSHVGLHCAVVPHFDNAEGGNHDTRYCYLGAQRLGRLRDLLDDECAIFGVDEHTAVIINVANDTLEVKGRGQAYWLLGDVTVTLERGATHPLSLLRGATAMIGSSLTEPVSSETGSAPEPQSAQEWGEIAAAGGPQSLSAIAHLVNLASSGGPGRIDPSSLVEGVLAARAQARADGQYSLADQLRDLLIEAGIEVRDTPTGATWQLADSAH